MRRYKLDKNYQVTVRCTPRSFEALESVLAVLRGGRLKFVGRKPTREAILNAAFLWMESLGPNNVEVFLGPYLRQFESDLAAIEAAIESGGEAKKIPADKKAQDTHRPGAGELGGKAEKVAPKKSRQKPKSG